MYYNKIVRKYDLRHTSFRFRCYDVGDISRKVSISQVIQSFCCSLIQMLCQKQYFRKDKRICRNSPENPGIHYSIFHIAFSTLLFFFEFIFPKLKETLKRKNLPNTLLYTSSLYSAEVMRLRLRV